MLLQPQHLQQHDRFLNAQLHARVCALSPYAWGFSHLEIDTQQLAFGKLALRSFSAVLPDGTPVGLPFDEMPTPLDIPVDGRDLTVVLALPMLRPGIAEVAQPETSESLARYRSVEYEALDANELSSSALLSIGKLRLRLAVAKDVADTHVCLGVARVLERRADQQVLLDAEFCPPSVHLKAAPPLGRFIDELYAMLRQRALALAARLEQHGASEAAQTDWRLMQLLNRSEPLVQHLSNMAGLHPEALYRELLQLAGALSTFAQTSERGTGYPPYRHDALAQTFAPLMLELRRALTLVPDARAVQIPLQVRQFGIRVALMQDPVLQDEARFVLAVRAQMPAEDVRARFAPQVKLGCVETIGDLVNLQLPGIGLRTLPGAPRQLPLQDGFSYFELDRDSPYWPPLSQSEGFALHVADSFPGLQMQFWAIRNS